jgi:hypothetical protein
VPKKIAVPEGKAVLWGVLMDMEDALIRLNRSGSVCLNSFSRKISGAMTG